eukprot:jgi/Ulvmu1/7170/UM034_0078.1
MMRAINMVNPRRRPVCWLLILSVVASTASFAFLIMLSSVPMGTLSPGLVRASRLVPKHIPSSVETHRNRLIGVGDASVCSISGTGCERSSATNAARNVSAQAVAAPVASTKAWWKDYPHLWTDVSTRDEFNEVVNDDRYDLVLVDWYATWCQGCQRAFPELSRLAALEPYDRKIKFVKVCIDGNKAMSKQYGVKVLPQISLFRPGYGQLLSCQAVPSKLKTLKKNLLKMLDNPGKFFKLDPNGMLVVLDEDPTPEAQQAKKEAQKLAASTGGLFEKLMKAAGGSPKASSDGAQNGTGNGATQLASTVTGATVKPAKAVVASSNAPGGSMAAAKAAFLEQWGGEYGYGGRVDQLYRDEVGCRMKPHEHYLDYTGSALYCSSALQCIFEDLQTNVFGNPHSANPSSTRSSDRIDAVRELVLKFFNASPAEYQVVFTKSATGALQLTGEAFPWTDDSVFRYTRENHNSVLGVREYALQAGGRFQAVEEEWVEDWLSGHKESDHFVHPHPGTPQRPSFSLFAFPAEENFSGVKYPLRWIREIQGMSSKEHEWKVLLDAAAFVPTQPLDLEQFPADFVTISFYKMFGYPTGLGALLVRTECIDLLDKVFWGGGTVALATSSDDFHVLKCAPSDKLEDGTVAFLDIIALEHMFAFTEGLGGVNAIQAHVHALTRHLFTRLDGLRHSNGAPLVQIFGKHRHPAPEAVQGGIVNFEVLAPDGAVRSYREVEVEAAEAGFHIRTGIHCNPGAAYRDVGLLEEEVETLAGEKEGCGDEVDFIEVKRPIGADPGIISDSEILPVIDGNSPQLGHPAEVAMKWVKKPLGSVRVSLGYMSTFEDVEAFCQFMENTYIDRPESSS